MNVFLTGGTGFVGSAVLRSLLDHGHQVAAGVRSEASAQQVTAAGATAALGDITDVSWLSGQFEQADAAIHTASPGDASSVGVDTAAATAAAIAFSGTNKPYVHTGGIWVYGSDSAITESTPYNPPALTAWRPDVEKIILDPDDLRGILIIPPIVHGHGKGLPNLIFGAPRDSSGALHLIGDGTQHWPTVHADDLADLYVRLIESPTARGSYVVNDGRSQTVGELGAAASRALGAGGAVHPETVEESQARLGELLAEALLLDQQVVSTKAIDELGWKASAPSLADEFASGVYTA